MLIQSAQFVGNSFSASCAAIQAAALRGLTYVTLRLGDGIAEQAQISVGALYIVEGLSSWCPFRWSFRLC